MKQCLNKIKCSFCFISLTRSLLWQWIWILVLCHEVCYFKCWHRLCGVSSDYLLQNGSSPFCPVAFIFSKVYQLEKNVVTWKPRGNCHTISRCMYSYQKLGGIKYDPQRGNVWSTYGTVRNQHKEACYP